MVFRKSSKHWEMRILRLFHYFRPKTPAPWESLEDTTFSGGLKGSLVVGILMPLSNAVIASSVYQSQE
jgi:hypothetical protein